MAWFHCFSGIAGDMALGACLDAGADLDELRTVLGGLPVKGWRLDTEPVLRCGVAATRALVSVEDDGIVRTFPSIVQMLEAADLPARVRDRSLQVFGALAEVEGRMHRRPSSQVHFHEVGGHDSIVDVVGTVAALELLGVDEVSASPVALGSGVVRTSHGLLPNPPPAVLALLEGVPVTGRDLNVELTTPTGAALVATLAAEFGPIPPMTVERTGYGAGTRELDGTPNCVQLVVGVRREAAEPGAQPLVLLESNVDDATGEQIADAIADLLEAGATDAWAVPVLMKKGRPGLVVCALADTALLEELRRVLVEATGTFGVRSSVVDRWAAARTLGTVEVGGVAVRVKVSPGRAKAEHDDARRAARELGVTVREVVARAEAAWRDRPDPDPEEA